MTAPHQVKQKVSCFHRLSSSSSFSLARFASASCLSTLAKYSFLSLCLRTISLCGCSIGFTVSCGVNIGPSLFSKCCGSRLLFLDAIVTITQTRLKNFLNKNGHQFKQKQKRHIDLNFVSFLSIFHSTLTNQTSASLSVCRADNSTVDRVNEYYRQPLAFPCASTVCQS